MSSSAEQGKSVNMESVASLTKLVKDFCEERDWDQFHTAKDLAIGMITEASELLEQFRFQSPSDIENRLATAEGRIDIGRELADVLFFLLRFSQRFGFDLGQELVNKIKYNAIRYPVDEFRGSNKKGR